MIQMIHPKKRPDAWRPSRPAIWHDCTKCTPQKSDGQAGRQKNTRKRGKKGGFFVFCRFAVQIIVFWDRRVKRRFFGLSGLIVLTNQNRPPDAGQNWQPSRPATITDDQSQSRQKLNRTPSELRENATGRQCIEVRTK